MRDIDVFSHDRVYNEDFMSFTFDMTADLTPLMTWNTHTVFASLVCDYETPESEINSITVWDQRSPRDREENHKINLTKEHIEYYLTDVNGSLRGRLIDVSFRYEIMTTVG